MWVLYMPLLLLKRDRLAGFSGMILYWVRLVANVPDRFPSLTTR